MSGRSQQVYDRKQRVDWLSNSRCVLVRFYLIAYMSWSMAHQRLVCSIHPHPRSASTPLRAQLQRSIYLLSTAVGKTSQTKRRRLYGLNSRFDRMLQEVSWTSPAPTSRLPHRRQAYFSTSSSIPDHDLPKTPPGASMGTMNDSKTFRKCLVPVASEKQSSDAMLWKSAHLSPSQVVNNGDQVLPNPSVG